MFEILEDNIVALPETLDVASVRQLTDQVYRRFGTDPDYIKYDLRSCSQIDNSALLVLLILIYQRKIKRKTTILGLPEASIARELLRRRRLPQAILNLTGTSLAFLVDKNDYKYFGEKPSRGIPYPRTSSSSTLINLVESLDRSEFFALSSWSAQEKEPYLSRKMLLSALEEQDLKWSSPLIRAFTAHLFDNRHSYVFSHIDFCALSILFLQYSATNVACSATLSYCPRSSNPVQRRTLRLSYWNDGCPIAETTKGPDQQETGICHDTSFSNIMFHMKSDIRFSLPEILSAADLIDHLDVYPARMILSLLPQSFACPGSTQSPFADMQTNYRDHAESYNLLRSASFFSNQVSLTLRSGPYSMRICPMLADGKRQSFESYLVEIRHRNDYQPALLGNFLDINIVLP